METKEIAVLVSEAIAGAVSIFLFWKAWRLDRERKFANQRNSEGTVMPPMAVIRAGSVHARRISRLQFWAAFLAGYAGVGLLIYLLSIFVR